MIGPILATLGVLVLGFMALAAAFVIGMRRKSGIVQGPIIWLGKHGFNKVGLRTAGQPGVATAIMRHRGRVSGRTFETPVGAVATADGFLISLPYGLRSNWLRNVLASGEATLVHDGVAHAVGRPEIIPLRLVETAFPPREQRMHAIFGVTEVLRLRTAAVPGTGAGLAA